jgi:putative spermidine/putrescine transport system substrate-binding protein
MLNRRQFIARSAVAGLAATGWPASAPAAGRRRREPVTLRVVGTHVTLQEQIRRAAERDLGIRLEFSPGGSAAVLQQASTRPESFDVYEQWSNSIKVLWRAGAIQPIDTGRIERWSEINSLSKTGRLTPTARRGRGDAPNRILFVQPDGALGPDPTRDASYLPYVHNVDSFGYDTRAVAQGTAYVDESWGWLLDERYRGRVGLVNEPTIGIFDAALAAQARGLMSFGDVGDMTVDEVDRLFDLLVDLKREGHFAGTWNSVPQSVRFMRDGRMVIGSMFSPAASELRGQGIPVVYAAPREGYRAWHGVMCLSSAAGEEVAEAAYAYMNWWLSGRAGAIMARQGYYISVPETARRHLSAAEWDYWYEGRPAREALTGPTGLVVAAAGSVRHGGSYEERFGNIAVWNTVMSTYEHSMLRWGEFLATEARVRSVAAVGAVGPAGRGR